MRVEGEESLERVEGTTIPRSWNEAVERILAGVGRRGLILGRADSGKTGFLTLLVNRAVGKGLRVAVIDGDLGQSDIGPPGSVSLDFVEEHVMDQVGKEETDEGESFF